MKMKNAITNKRMNVYICVYKVRIYVKNRMYAQTREKEHL